MSTNINDKLLVERYLQGELSGLELEKFSERLSADEGFKRAVEFQQLIHEGIKEAGEERLKELIQSSINYRRPSVPWGLKLILSFFFVTAIGVSLWFYLGTDQPSNKQDRSWFAFFEKTRIKDASDKKESQKVKQDSKAKSSSEPASAKTNPEEMAQRPLTDTSDLGLSQPASAGDTLSGSLDEDIIVKQDQLLISAVLPVNQKQVQNLEEKKAEESLADEAAGKLNPSADLPVQEKTESTFQVEFWISPINYRGYKLTKNQLILFGIEEPDAVKLFRVNDEMYMTYLKETYKLNASSEFGSYVKLKESEIPLALK